ncbi:expressed unknown protein (Partial), partial [Seminavis robusta]
MAKSSEPAKYVEEEERKPKIQEEEDESKEEIEEIVVNPTTTGTTEMEDHNGRPTDFTAPSVEPDPLIPANKIRGGRSSAADDASVKANAKRSTKIGLSGNKGPVRPGAVAEKGPCPTKSRAVSHSETPVLQSHPSIGQPAPRGVDLQGGLILPTTTTTSNQVTAATSSATVPGAQAAVGNSADNKRIEWG